MLIHVVKQGETIQSIADFYNVDVDRMILENGIFNPNNLVIGQTIVIVYPKVTYVVKEGDTLGGIAYQNNVSVMQILRNNPYLTNRQYIFPGETIVISYETDISRAMDVDGFTYPFIDRDILRKTLPFLTYLTIYNYRILPSGDIVGVDDEEIIRMAKEYGVAPMMLISTQDEQGKVDLELINEIFDNPEIYNKVVNNAIDLIKSKGFYGVNLYLQNLDEFNLPLVEEYTAKLSRLLKKEKIRFEITISFRTYTEGNVIEFGLLDYSKLASYADSVLFLSYSWGYSFGPPTSIIPFYTVETIMEYITIKIPSEIIFEGFAVVGYDWPLPYIPGETIATVITTDIAYQMARNYGAEIQFSKITETPYFNYTDENGILHVVWFKDARSIKAVVNLVPAYNLQGISLWEIMNFFDQLWLIINNGYEINKIWE